MKLLRTEEEFRQWMKEDFFHLHEGIPSIFEVDDVENELLLHMPKCYPCIIMKCADVELAESEIFRVVTYTEVHKWAEMLGIQ